jgi:coenzyme F420-0:L-glutamate ligase/coenzyme F420-1:gamma-L-glutamate ligase
LNETDRILGLWRRSLIVKDRREMICVNAGVDKSNIEGDSNYSLLPRDPYKSAKELMQKLKKMSGISHLGVVITDSSTRPFRRGLSHYAVGYAGFNGFIDYRGGKDIFGRTLKFKFSSVVDEISCAAGLVFGESDERIGASLIRGLEKIVTDDWKIEKLTVERHEDIYHDIVKYGL